ncbi:cinnamoyl-CoA reductase 2 [Sorghum bicolor]|uniref:cinnamoyl-CoA reductase 2 n=1 Tax=Sorghum bicolor TaxID=4558 RepID=UPI000B4241F2|nr:cinnamoyl-CoA reductase 2 [Sorghum bicolor]|eukprot:XP_021309219.1 cinnamoyl-CoA reductase 2 [Sorghum bicolor]
MASQLPRVCVTGGGGFIASWLVKLLLSRGYAVHATLRDPKNAHLKKLDRAPENLHLFKADVLDCETLTPAVQGCQGVFHLATPVPEDKILHPDVHKVVVMSSNAAVTSNPNWPQDRLKDESCWSDTEFCKEKEDWYSVAKTLAEQEASEYARNNGLNVVALCPPYVFGPLLQSSVNTSSKLLIYVIKGGPDVMTNRMWDVVDVRDVADALLLLYENDRSSGRYICSPNRVCTRDLVDLLKKMYPDVVDADHAGPPLSSQKLKDLGWEPRKLESTLSDSVQSYEKAGLLQGNPCRLPFLIRAWL